MQKQPNNHCPTRPTMHIHSFIPPPHCSTNAGRRPDPFNNPTLSEPASAGRGSTPLDERRPTGDPDPCPPTAPHSECRGDACVARVPQPIGNQR